MSNSHPSDAPDSRHGGFATSELLSAYLDGQLSAAERSAFEQKLDDDPQLREAVKAQGEIDASLARLYAAPECPADFMQQLEQQAGMQPSNRLPETPVRDRRRVRLIAAAIAACVMWLFAGWVFYDRATDDGYQQLALQDIYQQCVSDGFQPDWVCEDDKQFADTFQRRQGQPLLLGTIPGGEMVGLAYLSGLSRRATTMLARVEGEPILVFVDRLDRDPSPAEPSWWSGLHLFRREAGGLVFYEVSPLTEPRVMDAFSPVQDAAAASSEREDQPSQ